MRRGRLILGTVILMTACNRGSTPAITVPTLPTPTAPQAVYTGTITDSINGTGSLTVSVGTAGSSTGGTWVAAFSGQKTTTRIIDGTTSGTSYSATISDCSLTDQFSTCFPNCRETFSGTLTAGGLSGTYTEVSGDSCAAHRGSVSASRQ